MKPPAFEYHAPFTVEEVVALLGELDGDAKIIAGGQSLVPVMAMRLSDVGHLVDLRRVAELRGIKRGETSVHIGAATTQVVIERSPELAGVAPLLSRATPLIGHFAIRSRGTIGGSIAHADAAAEYPAVALTLDATLETLSPRGTRSVPAAKFFTGMWTTDLAADEVLTGVTLPVRRPRSGFAVEEFARRPGDFAIAGASVAVELDADDRVHRCGIGLFGLGSTPLRAGALEDAVRGSTAGDLEPEEIGRTAMVGLESVPSDLHGSADYRKRVGAAIVAAAWQRAVDEAGRG
jgi:carbon-monoxide dehydrogenase medium subunit